MLIIAAAHRSDIVKIILQVTNSTAVSKINPPDKRSILGKGIVRPVKGRQAIGKIFFIHSRDIAVIVDNRAKLLPIGQPPVIKPPVTSSVQQGNIVFGIFPGILIVSKVDIFFVERLPLPD